MGGLLAIVMAVVLTAAAAGPAIGSAAADPTQTRYSLVNGCYLLDTPTGPVAPAAGPYRMPATGLGEYLLYGRNQQVLNATLGSVNTVSSPSITSIWRVDGSGTTGFTLTNTATKLSGAVTFVPATGCAEYPEANDGTTGLPGPGVGPDGSIVGTVDPHAHVTAYEFMGGNFHCGRPWHRFGAMYALPDCDPMDCGVILGQPKCGRADIDRWLTELRNLGVSSFFPIHKFDNAFGGTKMDPAATGLLVNAGNFMQTGTFWNVQPCTGAESDSTQLSVPLAGNVNQFLA